MIDVMGTFHTECEIVNIAQPAKKVTVSKLLVDTGSEFTWVPEDALRQTDIEISKKDLQFVMANGQIVTRSFGYAIIRQGFETVDEIVFAQPGDLSLLGARTLEGFGAAVDSGKRRLVAAGPHVAAFSSLQ